MDTLEVTETLKEVIPISGEGILSAMHNGIVNNSIGDYASIFGLIITLIGFFLTVKKVKLAAVAVKNTETMVSEKSAEIENQIVAVKQDLRRFETVADVAQALHSMEDIKRLHRESKIEQLPEKYTALRKALVSIRAENDMIQDTDATIIQSVIAQLGTMEKNIDQVLFSSDKSLDIAKNNHIITKYSDKLLEILVKLRKEGGEE